MALIPCPECQQQVSDKASSCPHCGNPLKASVSPVSVHAQTARGKTVTTQTTAKNWKGVQLAGIGVMVLGIMFIFGGAEDWRYVAGILMIPVGIIITVVGSVAAWWHHG